jgi:hypothetical protein
MDWAFGQLKKQENRYKARQMIPALGWRLQRQSFSFICKPVWLQSFFKCYISKTNISGNNNK